MVLHTARTRTPSGALHNAREDRSTPRLSSYLPTLTYPPATYPQFHQRYWVPPPGGAHTEEDSHRPPQRRAELYKRTTDFVKDLEKSPEEKKSTEEKKIKQLHSALAESITIVESAAKVGVLDHNQLLH